MEEVRIDKWLWATRIFKTRTLAVEACKKGRISIDNVPVKPSRLIKRGEKLFVRKPPVTYTFIVKELVDKRIGAKLVPEYLDNITPKEQYEILELSKISGFVNRAKGLGRPTKKDRRSLEEFISPTYIDRDEDEKEEEEKENFDTEEETPQKFFYGKPRSNRRNKKDKKR